MPRICPLTKASNIVVEKEIETTYIIQKYKDFFFIDVTEYFHGYQTIQICRCLDTGYRFYYPFDIMGDSKFYERMQQFDWYYKPWKWEHQQASRYITPGKRVLEVGCGRGDFLRRMEQKGGICTGLELNCDAVERAIKDGSDVRQETVSQHAHHYQEYYDVVCSFQVLEHISAVYSFLEAQARCLKKGGRLIIAVPNNDSFFKYDQENVLTNMPPHHMGLWTRTSLVCIADIFQMTLERILYEPLQWYDFEWYRDIMVKRYIRTKIRQWLYCQMRFEILFKKYIELCAQYIRGHTIMIILVK